MNRFVPMAFALLGLGCSRQEWRPDVPAGGTDRDAAIIELLALHQPRTDSAIQRLVAIAKPAMCDTSGCTPLMDEKPAAIASELEMRYSEHGSIGGGGSLGFVTAKRPFPFDTLRVMCVGLDTLFVSAAAFERWERDYYRSLDMILFSREDTSHGAVYVVDFNSDPLRGARGVVTSIHDRARFVSEPPLDEERLTNLADRLSELNLGADEPLLRPALAKVGTLFVERWGDRPMPEPVASYVKHYGVGGTKPLSR
jgi:hypothetical protein